MYWEMEEGSGR